MPSPGWTNGYAADALAGARRISADFRPPYLIAQLICVLAVLLAGCSSAPPLPDLGNVPAFELTAEDGSPFRSAEALAGKVWVADFIFTNCPGPCPRMSSRMKSLQDALKGVEDFKLVSVTVDPDRDTAPVLAAYAKRFAADTARWRFLTGTKEALRPVAFQAMHLSDLGPALEHSTKFVLVDRKGRIRGYYDSTDSQGLRRLVDDSKRLIKERT